MKNPNLKKHFFTIILLVLGIYLTYDYFDNKNQIKNKFYGTKANKLRITLNVPIIDEYMKAVYKHDQFLGNRWESTRESPNGNEVLHVWKEVNPLTKNKELDDEDDGFRKIDKNGKIMQFNIYSTIIGDSISERKGRFFYYKSNPRMDKELDEKQIDSIAKIWNLNYLIKE
jgi:hypothetical protein